MFNSIILGLGKYLPENIVTNADLEKIMDTSNEWIIERTGIKERRHIKKGDGNSTASRYAPMMEACTFLDSPSTTSAITYKVQVRSHSGSFTMYINRRSNDTNFGVASNITLVEVEA